jgi:Flp pilus assembly protein TadB
VVDVMGTAAVAGLAGGLIVTGVLLALPVWQTDPGARQGRRRVPVWWRRVRQDRRARWRVVGACAVGVLGWAVTGWPAVAVLAAAGVWWLPRLLGPDRAGVAARKRTEAVATWVESLRDTLSAAAGLRQAIQATAPAAPGPIAGPVRTLAARLRDGHRLAEALRVFAAEVADPVADLAAAALIHAADNEARHLSQVLSGLADAARARAAAGLRVATSRAHAHTTVRIITATVLAATVGLILTDRPFLAPYHSAAGQVVLLVVGGVYAIGLWWLQKLATPVADTRVLAPTLERSEAVS